MNTSQINLYKEIHLGMPQYGASGARYLSEILLCISFLHPKSILDYGCGKGILCDLIKQRFPDIQIYGYDPAIPGKDVLPILSADLIICTDVLEHIPEAELPAVIQEISLISKNCFFALDHALAGAILSNGENAHCTIKPVHWYERLFSKYFSEMTVLHAPPSEPWKSVILTFGVNVPFYRAYYDLIKPKKKISKLKMAKYLLLSKLTIGKTKERYLKKISQFSTMG